MEIAWTIIGIVVPVLIGVGFSMIGLNPPEFRIARGCFWISAIILGVMNTVWNIKTDLPAWWRILAGALIWILIGVGLPEGLRWVTRRERREIPPKPTNEQPPIPTATTTEKPPTLLDLFNTEFPNTLRIENNDHGIQWSSGGILPIKAKLYADFPGRSKFMGFYVRQSPKTFEACLKLVDLVRPAMKEIPKK